MKQVLSLLTIQISRYLSINISSIPSHSSRPPEHIFRAKNKSRRGIFPSRNGPIKCRLFSHFGLPQFNCCYCKTDFLNIFLNAKRERERKRTRKRETHTHRMTEKHVNDKETETKTEWQSRETVKPDKDREKSYQY